MPSIKVINNVKNMQSRGKNTIQYIILHYTASMSSGRGSAQQTVKVLDDRGFSSDYAVDDYEILQFAPDINLWASKACQTPNKHGTTAGKDARNKNAVSIEMSSTLITKNKKDWTANNPNFTFTDKVLENTAYLCKLLIKKYNIPKSHIIRHYDMVGKACPGIIGWNLAGGSKNENKFKDFVNKLYNDKYQIKDSSEIPINDVIIQSNGTETTELALEDISKMAGCQVGNVIVVNGDNISQAALIDALQKKYSSGSTNSSPEINIPGIVNNVYQLATAANANKNTLKQGDIRKADFEALRNKMVEDTPNMGRDILVTAELYDSNILKGDQESKKERI